VTDDRAGCLVRFASTRQTGEIRHREVIAAVDSSPPQPFRDTLDRALIDTSALDEEHVQALVSLLCEQQAAGRAVIAPSATSLLVVRLELPRHRSVGDGPHVGLVNPHPERVRDGD